MSGSREDRDRAVPDVLADTHADADGQLDRGVARFVVRVTLVVLAVVSGLLAWGALAIWSAAQSTSSAFAAVVLQVTGAVAMVIAVGLPLGAIRPLRQLRSGRRPHDD